MAHAGPGLVAAVLFDGFELLDAFGPLELFGLATDEFRTILLGPSAGPVRSAQGPRAVADRSYLDAPECAVVLVPGGIGRLEVVNDEGFLSWLAEYGERANFITSVCTGSGLLAAAGLLDGYRATSNKERFAWAREQGPRVDWVAAARWVEDRNRWTSSGVTAGMDMTLALIEHMHGDRLATRVAEEAEYEWHRDPGWDPFATIHGVM